MYFGYASYKGGLLTAVSDGKWENPVVIYIEFTYMQ